MSFKNLFFLFIFLLVNSFSSYSLSTYRHTSVNQQDTSIIKKPVVIFEMDQNRILLLDATVELDQALLAGVNASLDTLNVPVKNSTAKKDTVEKLREMKRMRERNEMKAYLDYMKDSLTSECTKLNKEKESIQTRLGLNVVQKNESENSNKKQPAIADTSHVAMLPPQKSSGDSMVVKPPDTEKSIPTVALKKEKKHSKRYKNAQPVPADTAITLSATAATTTKPVEKTKAVSSPDNSIDNPQPTLAKADVLGDQRKIANANTVSPEGDTAMRIKSRYYTAYAQKSMVEKDNSKATDYINSAIELWKDNYDAWFTKADIEKQTGNSDKAMEAYRQCYRIDSTRPKLYYHIALLNLQSNNSGKALYNLNKAISLDPNFIMAYMKRASIYNDTANYNAAIADYDYILTINRNYYNAYKGRGISELMQRKFKTAIDDFTRYIIYDQSDAEVYYYRGVAKISNNEWLDGCLELSMSANMGYAAAAVAQKKNCE